jgi:WD40 repeat protein
MSLSHVSAFTARTISIRTILLGVRRPSGRVCISRVLSDIIVRHWTPGRSKPLRRVVEGNVSQERNGQVGDILVCLFPACYRLRRGRLWDLASGKLIGEPFHPRAMRVAFSPDGSRILSGGGGPDSGIACLWDAATLKCLGEFHQHRRTVNGVAFSPDGSKFLTGSFDGTTQLWDAATLEPIGEPLVHQSEVKAVAFSPDSSKFLIGFADGTVRLWDLATLKPIGTPLQYLRIVCAVAFSPDGSQFLACSIDRTARIRTSGTAEQMDCSETKKRSERQ